eukprot:Lankesteria_metandrocarpae@DN2883_c0_g1_i1.p1
MQQSNNTVGKQTDRSIRLQGGGQVVCTNNITELQETHTLSETSYDAQAGNGEVNVHDSVGEQTPETAVLNAFPRTPLVMSPLRLSEMNMYTPERVKRARNYHWQLAEQFRELPKGEQSQNCTSTSVDEYSDHPHREGDCSHTSAVDSGDGLYSAPNDYVGTVRVRPTNNVKSANYKANWRHGFILSTAHDRVGNPTGVSQVPLDNSGDAFANQLMLSKEADWGDPPTALATPADSTANALLKMKYHCPLESSAEGSDAHHISSYGHVEGSCTESGHDELPMTPDWKNSSVQSSSLTLTPSTAAAVLQLQRQSSGVVYNRTAASRTSSAGQDTMAMTASPDATLYQIESTESASSTRLTTHLHPHTHPQTTGHITDHTAPQSEINQTYLPPIRIQQNIAVHGRSALSDDLDKVSPRFYSANTTPAHPQTNHEQQHPATHLTYAITSQHTTPGVSMTPDMNALRRQLGAVELVEERQHNRSSIRRNTADSSAGRASSARTHSPAPSTTNSLALSSDYTVKSHQPHGSFVAANNQQHTGAAMCSAPYTPATTLQSTLYHQLPRVMDGEGSVISITSPFNQCTPVDSKSQMMTVQSDLNFVNPQVDPVTHAE